MREVGGKLGVGFLGRCLVRCDALIVVKLASTNRQHAGKIGEYMMDCQVPQHLFRTYTDEHAVEGRLSWINRLSGAFLKDGAGPATWIWIFNQVQVSHLTRPQVLDPQLWPALLGFDDHTQCIGASHDRVKSLAKTRAVNIPAQLENQGDV
jgi:hypothetical protein